MTPLTIVYVEFINRSKLTEQKNPFEYIVPTPSRGIETNIFKFVYDYATAGK